MSARQVRQRESHAHLLRDASGAPIPSAASGRARLDAIIVPTARPASFLQPIIELAAGLDVLLVVLASKQARTEHVAQRVAKVPGARCLIVPVAAGWTDARMPRWTAHPSFDAAKGGHASDLSLKRNLGLLIARLHGWNKVVFVDDDIRLNRLDHVARLAGQLETHQAAGMVVPDYPDNSVVCHARRLAGLRQGVFVTGAVLAVHTNNLPLSFFPNIYNEDWFFFAREAAARQLPQVGRAAQEEYRPFGTPDRARGEEFGDLLAEGLFALFSDGSPQPTLAEHLRGATPAYWQQFIEVRRGVIEETVAKLVPFADRDPDNLEVTGALASLEAAGTVHTNAITPALCADFVAAWQEDLQEWGLLTTKINSVGGTREAMDALGLANWRMAEFGCEQVEDPRGSRRVLAVTSA